MKLVLVYQKGLCEVSLEKNYNMEIKTDINGEMKFNFRKSISLAVLCFMAFIPVGVFMTLKWKVFIVQSLSR